MGVQGNTTLEQFMKQSPLDAAIDRWMLAQAGDIQHGSCTCRMGLQKETSVVGSDGQVHGVQGLRVIDASIFPFIPRANTHLSTVMVAEKMADMLKRQRA